MENRPPTWNDIERLALSNRICFAGIAMLDFGVSKEDALIRMVVALAKENEALREECASLFMQVPPDRLP